MQGAIEASMQLDEMSRLIVDAKDGIYGLDADGFITFANPAAAKMTGWSGEALVGRSQHDIVRHSDSGGGHAGWRDCTICSSFRDGAVHHREDQIFWRGDESNFPVAYTSHPLVRDGRVGGALIVFQDISERRRNEQWERDKNRIFAGIASHEPIEATLQEVADAFVALCPTRSIAIWLRAGEELRLISQTASPGHLLPSASPRTASRGAAASRQDVAASEQGAAAPEKEEPEAMTMSGAGGGADVAPASHERGIDDRGALCCLASPLISASGEVLGTVEVFARSEVASSEEIRQAIHRVGDIARLAIEHQKLHSELIRQSQRDHLTGLPNRMALEERLARAMVTSRQGGARVGVAYIDLDRFKRINDSFGHAGGDLLLQQVSDRLAKCSCGIDTLARQGGDEFILILPDLGTALEATEMCDRLLQELSRPFSLAGRTLLISASIGVSIYPDDGDSPAGLLQNADTALYAAKRAGRGQQQIYNSALGHEVRRMAELEIALYAGIDEKQFFLMYQPLYGMDKDIIGFEALLRWRHPDLGLIEPDRFLSVAEETGAIIPIGDWVVEEACRQAMEWHNESLAPLTMFVNLSASQLRRPDFPRKVGQVLERSGLAPSRLQFEVPERWILADLEASAYSLRQLRELGVGISVGACGVGDATLRYLHEVPLDTIKIDRSLIARLDGSECNLSAIRAIIDLARELGLKTVAEGVETQLQLDQLREVDCAWLQGFLLDRPLTVEIAHSVLENKRIASLGSPPPLVGPTKI